MKIYNQAFFVVLFIILFPVQISAKGNITIDSFNNAKRMLERQVYFDHRLTIYCNAEFDEHKNITIPNGFQTSTHPKRTQKVEWEHAVPVENLGRAFPEWREGSPECVNKDGSSFKGRKCAEKVNMEFRYMQSDMYNLFPAIGAVNATRSNHQYAQLSETAITFGSCPAKTDGTRFEPPDYAKGELARAALYMEASYPRYSISSQQKRLFSVWDKMYQVTEWECKRASRIEKLQGNENSFVKKKCLQAGIPY